MRMVLRRETAVGTVFGNWKEALLNEDTRKIPNLFFLFVSP
jgi:hypothetical protein